MLFSGADSHLNRGGRFGNSDEKPGAALKWKAHLTKKQYRKKGLQAHLTCAPLVWDSYGREGSEAADFFKQVCQRYVQTRQLDGTAAEYSPAAWFRHPFSRRWHTRLHQALQIGSSYLQRLHLHYGLAPPGTPHPAPPAATWAVDREG